MIGVANGNGGYRVAITGIGCNVPDRVLTTDELATMVDTSDDWIRERTGIRCIFTSAFGDPETRHRAAECCPFGFVRKPYFPAELQRALGHAVETLRGR